MKKKIYKGGELGVDSAYMTKLTKSVFQLHLSDLTH